MLSVDRDASVRVSANLALVHVNVSSAATVGRMTCLLCHRNVGGVRSRGPLPSVAMVQIDGWLDTGDKVASVVGAFAGVAAVLLALYTIRRRRKESRRLSRDSLARLLRAQELDATRHRYRFFGDHIPSLRAIYVRQHIANSVTAQRMIGVEQMLGSLDHTLLLGGAGAGKSALVAAVVAESALVGRSGRRQKVLTVAVSASDLVGRDVPEALAWACLQHLKVEIPAQVFEVPPVTGGRWRVMIDGVDEIVDSGTRSRLLWSLKHWMQQPPRPHQLVISSRPLPDSEIKELYSARSFDLQPFDRGDLDAFALRWFNARHPDVPELASQRASRFVARVAGARLGPVARVPLLATIAALVFEGDDDAPLPSSRAALYERFVAHLLTGRHELRHMRKSIESALSTWDLDDTPIPADFAVTLNSMLDALGAAQIREPRADLVDVATEWSQRLAGKTLPNSRQLLRDLLLATGMFAPRGERLQFNHQSFAEFFAARENAPRFDVGAWRELMANPAGRSLAAFMAALRQDSDLLVAGLLDDDFGAAAAGDLLADGVAVRPETRKRIIDSLIAAVMGGNTSDSSESLRVLRELSVDADVFHALVSVTTYADAHPWARAAIADAIADVDPPTGVRLLREAAQVPDPTIREWVEKSLTARGFALGPVEWEASSGVQLPLGALGRQALTDQVDKQDSSDNDRVDAAVRLADDGEDSPLRGLLETPGIADSARLRAAEELAERGDDAALVAFAGGSLAERLYVPDAWGSHSLRYGALASLHHRRHPIATALLESFVHATDAPCTYGAAAMLAEIGRLDTLTDMATAPHRDPVIALAAARTLAAIATTAALERARELATAPLIRAWMAAALLDRGRVEYATELRGLLRRIRHADDELYATLAAHGDTAAKRRMRRTINGTIALSARGDVSAVERLKRTARRSGRWSTRVHAAAALGRLRAEWEPLRELAATTRPRRRLHAATRIATEIADFEPLVGIVLDIGLPTRHRVRATEILWRKADSAAEESADQPTWEDFPRHGVAYQASERGAFLHKVPFQTRRHLAAHHVEALARLAANPTTPVRLRIANAGRLRDQTVALLTSIATDPSNASWHRLQAADKLEIYDHNGDKVLRNLLADIRIPRLLRWYILTETDDDSWEEFRDPLERYRHIDEGPDWLRWPRLAWLFLSPLTSTVKNQD